MGLESHLGDNILTTTLDTMVNWARKSSLWPMPFGLACCAIEMMAAVAPRYDLARFGAEVFRFSTEAVRPDDCCQRTLTYKMASVARRIYDQMPEPKWVIAMGRLCDFRGCVYYYSVVQGPDQVMPVDVYLPGCPPRPEALIHAIMEIQRRLRKNLY